MVTGVESIVVNHVLVIAAISYCTILNIVIILVNLTAVDVNFDISSFSL
jgi:hypothetical protein